MANLKTDTEVMVDIDIDVECATCGNSLGAYFRGTTLQVEFCDKCYNKLEERIEELNDKLL